MRHSAANRCDNCLKLKVLLSTPAFVSLNKKRFNNLAANTNDASSRYMRYAVNIYRDRNKSLGLLPSGKSLYLIYWTRGIHFDNILTVCGLGALV